MNENASNWGTHPELNLDSDTNAPYDEVESLSDRALVDVYHVVAEDVRQYPQYVYDEVVQEMAERFEAHILEAE